jgi:cytochrome c-type biogenesis protein CcmE
VRVTGLIQGESIDWNAQDLILKFEIADEASRLPVVYKGLRPDMFQDGAQAVVEGRYTEGGTFEAHNLVLKCPSKYEEAATATAQP